jgi:hypothetical protein
VGCELLTFHGKFYVKQHCASASASFLFLLGNLSVPIIKIDLTCLFYAVWEVQKEDSCRRFEQKMEASYTEYNSTLLNFFFIGALFTDYQ